MITSLINLLLKKGKHIESAFLESNFISGLIFTLPDRLQQSNSSSVCVKKIILSTRVKIMLTREDAIKGIFEKHENAIFITN